MVGSNHRLAISLLTWLDYFVLCPHYQHWADTTDIACAICAISYATIYDSDQLTRHITSSHRRAMNIKPCERLPMFGSYTIYICLYSISQDPQYTKLCILMVACLYDSGQSCWSTQIATLILRLSCSPTFVCCCCCCCCKILLPVCKIFFLCE